MSRPFSRITGWILALVLVAGLAGCSRDQDALPDPSTVAPVSTAPRPSTDPSRTLAASPVTSASASPVTSTSVAPPVRSSSPTAPATATGTPPAMWVTQSATNAPTSPNTAATLPPPTQDPNPAATSGPLHLNSQPRPPGWTPTAAHAPTATRAREPRYAAWEAMMVGCAEVDRRTWTDPAHALEIAVTQQGRPGVGLVMQFSSGQAALTYHSAFQKQLLACPARPGAQVPGVTRIASGTGLWVGRRLLPDGSVWAEIASVNGATVRLWILQDAGDMDDAQLRQLAAHLAA